MDAVTVADLAFCLAARRIERVAQDGEQPGAQVRSGLELVHVRPRLDDGVLHQIIGRRPLAGQRQRKGPQCGQVVDQLVARMNRRGIGHGNETPESLGIEERRAGKRIIPVPSTSSAVPETDRGSGQLHPAHRRVSGSHRSVFPQPLSCGRLALVSYSCQSRQTCAHSMQPIGGSVGSLQYAI